MNRQIAGLGRRSAYALLNLFTGLVSLVFLPVLLLCALLCLLGIGLVLLPAALRALHAWATWHQSAAARLLGRAAPEQHSPHEGSGWGVLRRQVQDPRTRRELGWLVMQAVFGILLGLLALGGVGIVLATILAGALWWTPMLADHVQFLGEPVTSWSTAAGLGGIQLVLGIILWLLATVLAIAHGRLTLSALPVHEMTVSGPSSGVGGSKLSK